MILPYRSKWPHIHETAFVAPSADIIGDVHIGDHSSVWFQSVVRGDVHRIQIGSRTNVQDHAMLHVTRGKSPLTVGHQVTIGHHAVLHGCRLGNLILVGMGAILMDDVEIADECLIGAGTLLTQGMKIPPCSLVLGSPGKVVRTLTQEERQFLKQSAENYVNDAIEYHGNVAGPRRVGSHDLDLEILSSEELLKEELLKDELLRDELLKEEMGKSRK